MKVEKSNFKEIAEKAQKIIERKSGPEAILNDVAQLLFDSVEYYDWVGFYILDQTKNELWLGPFVGASTQHTHIPVGKGVCGQVAATGQTMVVQDVTALENYLSCSLHVQSEIVVPILKKGQFVAEIDIDSHAYAPFDDEDVNLLTRIADLLSEKF